MTEESIQVSPGTVPGEIDITVKGPWLHTILFEIPVLAIVNEVYFRNVCKEPGWEVGRKRLQKKMRLVTGDPDLADLRVAEYGTRRRFSKVWHEEVLVNRKAQIGVHFEDRKSEVKGKSVPGREVCGGRGKMKKQKIC